VFLSATTPATHANTTKQSRANFILSKRGAGRVATTNEWTNGKSMRKSIETRKKIEQNTGNKIKSEAQISETLRTG
jgi:hypothetical protein